MFIFIFVIGIIAPFVAVLVLNQNSLRDIKKSLHPFNWINMRSYILLPVLLFGLFFLREHQDWIRLLRFQALIFFGYIVALQDFRSKTIPNRYVLGFLATWVIITVPELVLRTESTLRYLSTAGLGFLAAGGFFLLLYLVSNRGLGGGDVKYIAVAGLYLGLYGILSAIFFASILSSLTAGILLLLKRIGRKDSIPLAPFLYVGILITIFVVRGY